ncbi:MAG: alpha/beta hydrolase, partial [Chloroflexi bacterium]|nr:alpha/beta hydrolase [Chloroflexota bacterium]
FWRFILRKTIKEPRLTIPQHRAQAAKTARLAGRVPQDVTIEELKIDGLRAIWIRPTGADNDLVFLHLHGGGYVTGSIDSYRMMCIPLARTLKMNLLLPEYRLAPEHPFPAALEDALAVYRWLLAQGHQPGNIVICGDSAGGGLTLATIQALRAAGEPLPGAVICLSPWADLTHQGQSHLTKAKSEVMLKTDVLKEWALCYTDAANLTNPLVSPVYADFHDFPPLLIQVGSEEILLDDARMVAEKASAAGVEVTLKVWDDLWHVWPALGELLPESRQSFEEIRQFIASNWKAD